MASEEAGYIANNPQSSLWGDTHHYDYKWFRNWFKNQKDPDNNLRQIRSNNWEWQNYPKTRFASEYGFQAFPAFSVLEPVIRVSKLFGCWKKWINQNFHNLCCEENEALARSARCGTGVWGVLGWITGKNLSQNKNLFVVCNYQAKSLSYTERVVLQIQCNILQTPL